MVDPALLKQPGSWTAKVLAIMDTLSKVCASCKNTLPLSEFYTRNGKPHSYCKACIKAGVKTHPLLDTQKPKDASEMLAIQYLTSRGIPSLPGKALRYSHVDIIAFGCVRVEVKYSRLRQDITPHFKWTLSPLQYVQGVRGDVMMIICNYGNHHTFHFFPTDFPAFYIDGRLKTGFTFTPDAMFARKFGSTRTVMTQPMMDAAQDNTSLIQNQLFKICEDLRVNGTGLQV